MAKIETWFPCAIYYEDDLFSKEQNKEWEKHILSIEPTIESGGEAWFGDTFTSLEKYDLRKDKQFDILIEKVTEHVNAFAREHNCQGEYECTTAWFNVNRDGTFQEYHTHPNNIFSAIYYVSAPEGAGGVVFEDPKEPDMMPLKNIPWRNQLSYSVTRYNPLVGKLLIFRSYMEHLVEPGTNTDPRISIALNFR